MSELVTDCPRCGARSITFDVLSEIVVERQYNWQNWYEAFTVCRHCHKSTVFVLSERHDGDYNALHRVGLLGVDGSINSFVSVERHISLRDVANVSAPEYVPEDIEAAFDEGAVCLTVGCPNAASTMFRLCVDLATQPLLPEESVDGLNATVRRSLGLRLKWLFDNGHLPEALRDLSTAVKEDGNDGAHRGSLSTEDAEDLLDFTEALLERMFTEPERLRLAKQRRDERRASD